MSAAEKDVVAVAEEWLPHVRELVGQGWDYLEFLTAVDQPEQGALDVVVGLRRIGADAQVRLLSTRLDRCNPVVDSLVPVLAAAAWHERETHEMFGVRFMGNDDLSPLLWDRQGEWPLRRTASLPSRLTTRWPGLSDPSDNPPSDQPGSSVPGSGRTRSRRRTAAIPGNCELWEP